MNPAVAQAKKKKNKKQKMAVNKTRIGLTAETQKQLYYIYTLAKWKPLAKQQPAAIVGDKELNGSLVNGT